MQSSGVEAPPSGHKEPEGSGAESPTNNPEAAVNGDSFPAENAGDTQPSAATASPAPDPLQQNGRDPDNPHYKPERRGTYNSDRDTEEIKHLRTNSGVIKGVYQPQLPAPSPRFIQQPSRPSYPSKRNTMSPTAAPGATYPNQQGGWTSYYATRSASRYPTPHPAAYGSYAQPS